MNELKLESCTAPLWAYGGHAQTILSFCLPITKANIPHQDKILTLPDGDRLMMLYTEGQSNYVIYLFHGLTGDASVSYMERTAKMCFDEGHTIYRVNHRDCGEGEGLAIHPYHSGRGEDISEVIALGRREHPGKKHIVIGFSLSGNALLTLLTGLRGTVLPDYAISVNAPIDLAATVTRLQQGVNRIYDFHFIQRLRHTVRLKYARRNLTQKYQISRLDTLNDFDEIYTALEGGFKNAAHYYKSCSTVQHLSKVQIPTILLTSEDDPFIPYEIYQNAKLSDTTQLHIEKVGGHLGYLSKNKTPLGTHQWLDYALHKCLQVLIKS